MVALCSSLSATWSPFVFFARHSLLDGPQTLRLTQQRLTYPGAAYRSRFGVAARGVVFVIAGVFLVLAALRTDEQEVRGLGGALSAILEQPFFGNFLLGIVAVGLVAYGLLMVAVARYRRIAPRDAL